GNHCKSDIFLQERSRAAGGDVTDLFAAGINIEIVTRDAAVDQFETDDLAFNAGFFHFGNDIAADEIAFIKFCYPAESGFERRDLVAEFMAVKRHSGFEPQRISSGQSRRKNAVFLAEFAYFQKFVPELNRKFARCINLESILARITCSRNDGFDAVNTAGREPVIFYLADVDIRDGLKYVEGFRALNGDLAEIRAGVSKDDLFVIFLVRCDP